MHTHNIQISKKHILIDSILLSITLSLIFIVSALKIYNGNPSEFIFPFYDLIFFVKFIFICVFIILFLVLLTFNRLHLYQFFSLFFFALIIILWIQYNYFNWDYNVLDGTSVQWNNFDKNEYIELTFFSIFIISLLIFKKIYLKIKSYLLIIILIAQIADVWSLSNSNYQPELDKIYTIDESQKFVFGKKNIILIVLDAFQGSVFNEIINSNPEYAKKFKDFTYFKNASCSIPSTKVSLINILSGISYDNSTTVREYQRNSLFQRSIPIVLKEHGYSTEYYSVFGYGILPIDEKLWTNAKRKTNIKEHINEYNKLVQATFYRLSPQILKKEIYKNGIFTSNNFTLSLLSLAAKNHTEILNLNNENVNNLKENIDNNFDCCNNLSSGINPDVDFIRSMPNNLQVDQNKNFFKFYHLQGLHPPRNIDENFRFDPLLNENSDSMPSSGRGILKLVNIFLDKLIENNIYENSLIIILSDHGNSRSVNPSNSVHRKKLDDKSLRLGFNTVKGTSIPLILVKKPYYKNNQMEISEVPVTLGDIPNTVMELIGAREKFPGLSMFSDINGSRERLFWIHSYHEGRYDYYGDLQEYMIKGNVYEDSAWSITGNLLKPKKTSFNEFYDERKINILKMEPLKLVNRRFISFSDPPFGYLENSFNEKKAFDRIPKETFWTPIEKPNGKCASAAKIGLKFETSFTLKAITLRTRWDLTYQAPKSWILEGSNDGHNWVELINIHQDTQWEPGGKVKIFKFEENNKEFSTYRLDIKESQDGKCISIDEIEFFE